MCASRVAKSSSVLLWLVVTGCQIVPGGGGGGGDTPTVLLSRSAVTIPPDQLVAFTFQAQAARLVTITVQASTDDARPDFVLAEGIVDSAGDVTLDEAIIRTADFRTDGQAIDSFIPDAAGSFTLFVEDRANSPDATFSITITQD